MSPRPETDPVEQSASLGLVVDVIQAGQTHALRHAVLRPHQPIQEMVYEGDDLPTTVHLGALVGSGGSRRLVGVVTLSVAPMPDMPRLGDHRLRGMAVEPSEQGRGVGGRLIGEAFRHISRRGGQRIWCNARVSAMGFYRRHGFAIHGDEFDLPGIGPHYVLYADVDPRLG
ncbi:MAG: GNAT family N-acetyltransferase [Planctomycetota bacterium]